MVWICMPTVSNILLREPLFHNYVMQCIFSTSKCYILSDEVCLTTSAPTSSTSTESTTTTTESSTAQPSLYCYTPTSGGNADESICVFPFFYKGFFYGSCTKNDHNRLWCATTGNYSEHGLWGNCLGKYVLCVMFRKNCV